MNMKCLLSWTRTRILIALGIVSNTVQAIILYFTGNLLVSYSLAAFFVAFWSVLDHEKRKVVKVKL